MAELEKLDKAYDFILRKLVAGGDRPITWIWRRLSASRRRKAKRCCMN